MNFWLTRCHISRLTCHVSHVTCQMSNVKCHMSCVLCHIFFFLFFLFLDKVVEQVGVGSVINGAYPVYLIQDTTIRVAAYQHPRDRRICGAQRFRRSTCCPRGWPGSTQDTFHSNKHDKDLSLWNSWSCPTNSVLVYSLSPHLALPMSIFKYGIANGLMLLILSKQLQMRLTKTYAQWVRWWS